MNQPTPSRPRIPIIVWALALVSMFMDISSEMIHALVPVYLTASLGISVATVGLIDGVAEAKRATFFRQSATFL